MECKLQIRKNQIIKRTELIDTLWNVNMREIWGEELVGEN